jgi:hypothetical protein
MSSLFDYLEWRGDLSFKAAPFNDVDNILLSIFTYYPWDGIAGGLGDGTLITLKDAAAALLDALKRKRKNLTMAYFFKENQMKLLESLEGAPRFAAIKLGAFVNHVDTQIEKQFSAVTFILGKGALPYIAFRGTDDTIAGWKEDFNMVFSDPIPAQAEAVSYLEKASGLFTGRFNTGGHSKGGNLAVFASAYCLSGIKKRIRRIYCNDGPGLQASVVASAGYKAIASRIAAFVPQTSIVGLLFEHEDDYVVVESDEKGFMQHNPFSWAVTRDALRCLDAVSRESRSLNKALTDWLAGMDATLRRRFIDALFDILQKTGASSINDITADWLKSAMQIIKAIQEYDKETKGMLLSTFAALFEIARGQLTSALKERVKSVNLPLAPRK